MSVAIKNLKVYNERMKSSIGDKLFFVNWIKSNIKVIIDYGCADGALIQTVAEIRPDLTYYGYDISNKMIKLSSELDIKNAKFYTDWELMVKDIDESFCHEDVAINLSSVIHEVYSYCDEQDIKKFWEVVCGNNWGQIFVRDMLINVDDDLFTEMEIWHLMHLYPKQMADYKMRWGHYDAYDIVHFLLKYRYTENWERELNENYSPLCCAGKINDLLNLYSKNTGSYYEQIYGHQYLLPYIRETVFRDTDIDLRGCTTHYKAIFNNCNC